MKYFALDNGGTRSLTFHFTVEGREAELIVRQAVPRGAPEAVADLVILKAAGALVDSVRGTERPGADGRASERPGADGRAVEGVRLPG